MSRLGISFFVQFEPLGHRSRLMLRILCSLALDCDFELKLQFGRLCQRKTLRHRVQNVFWQECYGNPRTHSCSRFLHRGNLEFGTSDPSAVLPRFVWPFCFLLLRSQFASFFTSEICFTAQFLSSISKDLRERICVQTQAYFTVGEFVSRRFCLMAPKTFLAGVGLERTRTHTLVPGFPTGDFLRVTPYSARLLSWFPSTFLLLSCALSIGLDFHSRDLICCTVCVIHFKRFDRREPRLNPTVF